MNINSTRFINKILILTFILRILTIKLLCLSLTFYSIIPYYIT